LKALAVAGLAILIISAMCGYSFASGNESVNRPNNGISASTPVDNLSENNLVPLSRSSSVGNTGIDLPSAESRNNVTPYIPLSARVTGIPPGLLAMDIPVSSATSVVPGDTLKSGRQSLGSGGAVLPTNYNGDYWWDSLPSYFTAKANTHPAITNRPPGTLEMFYYNTTGVLYFSEGAYGNDEWTWTYSLNPYQGWLYSPAACSWGSSHIAVFCVHDTHNLYYYEWTGSGHSWNSYQVPVGMDVYSTPAVVSRHDGNIELVYINSGGHPIHLTYTQGVGWSSPETIDTAIWQLGDGFSLVSTSSNNFFVIGWLNNPAYVNPGHIWTREWLQCPGCGWQPWSYTGIRSYSFVSAGTRKYSDALTQWSTIDIDYESSNDPGSSDLRWCVSRDEGLTWSDGEAISSGSILIFGSPRYDRVEFIQNNGGYLWEMMKKTPQHEKIGVSNGVNWYLDTNGNGVWNPGSDKPGTFGGLGWIPIIGDWNADNVKEIGVSNGVDWYLDYNGNGIWDSGIDKHYIFGGLGWTPVVGRWNFGYKGDHIGVSNGVDWYLDVNGDGIYNPGTEWSDDKHYTFGALGWKPVVLGRGVGGSSEIGVSNGVDWYLDMNGDGVYNPGPDYYDDKHYTFGALGWTPVVGNWGNVYVQSIGVTNGVDWYLDSSWDGIYEPGFDLHYTYGALGWTPVIGDWNGDGMTNIGVTNGVDWYLDMNGDGAYNSGTDKKTFGGTGWIPIVGEWS
jgi:hypothetical protein